ncbi:MAG: response regulator transcription factor [Clostridia bacterium]|nr:response regulator transcription factor [Clostridia bacterium]
MEISVCIYNVNNDEAEILQRFIAAVLFHADYRAKILSCSTETALRKTTIKYPYVDMLFLPASSFGLSFAEELRKTNRTTTIVFLADDDKNVYRAFHSLPIAYLIDPKEKQKLSETVLKAASWVMSGKKTFCHESRTQILQLKYKDIDYFESEYRIVHIHRTDGTYETITAKLDEVEAMLPSNNFCRCHKSYLVNLENIASVNKSEKTVLFKSGAKVFSSKAQYPTLIAALKGDVICETV